MIASLAQFRKAALRGALAALAAFAGLGGALAQDRAHFPSLNEGGEGTSQRVTLSLNKSAIVELPRPASDVMVAQPSVVDAVVRSSRRVYLLGLEVGQTNAFFFDAQGRQILNLEIRVERDVADLELALSRLIPDSRIEIEAINDNVVLSGTVANNSEAATAADIAARFIGDPAKVLNMVAVRERDQVMLRVRVVEMQRRLVKQLGVDLSGMVTLDNATINAAAQNIGGGVAAGLAGTATRFFNGGDSSVGASFAALEQTGLVRTLAEPNLTAISGETASFLAGGEFPIPVGQENGAVTIEFKRFGVSLGFTPLVLSKGRINLKVATEVSEVTTENSFFLPSQQRVQVIEDEEPQFLLLDVDGDGDIDQVPNPNFEGDQQNVSSTPGLTIPGLTVRRAETTVEMPSGGSLVMAGLLQEDIRETVNGVPGLKDIAVLGQLFRSRDYANNETELVVIVTPYLVEPRHMSQLTDPVEGFKPASDLQAALLGKLFSTYGLQGADTRERTLQGPIGFILD